MKETRRISLDAGQNLNRIEVRLSPVETTPASALPVAIGIQKRRGTGELGRDENAASPRWASYWEPPQDDNRQIGCAVALPEGQAEIVETEGHVLMRTTLTRNQPLVYFAGAAWSRGPDFTSPAEWHTYLHTAVRRLAAPLRVGTGPRPVAAGGRP